jgi:hypothetical protein
MNDELSLCHGTRLLSDLGPHRTTTPRTEDAVLMTYRGTSIVRSLKVAYFNPIFQRLVGDEQRKGTASQILQPATCCRHCGIPRGEDPVFPTIRKARMPTLNGGYRSIRCVNIAKAEALHQQQR